MTIRFLRVLIIGIIFSFPFGAHAFEVVSQKAYRLDTQTVLFAITYEFGFLNANLWMSLGAREAGVEQVNIETYVVVDSNGEQIQSSTAGVVLSTAIIEKTGNSHLYFVPQKERSTFMLLVLVKSDAQLPTGTSLKVTSLPFVIQKNGEQKTVQKVDDSILKDYTVTLK